MGESVDPVSGLTNNTYAVQNTRQTEPTTGNVRITGNGDGTDITRADYEKLEQKYSELEYLCKGLRQELQELKNTNGNDGNQHPTLKPLGNGSYTSDDITKPEKSIPEDVLSKDAKALSKEKQLEILKKFGIDVSKLQACKGEDGSYSFKASDNKMFKVVQDKDQIKLLNTTISDNKASTQVFKVNDNGTLSGEQLKTTVTAIFDKIDEIDEECEKLRSAKPKRGENQRLRTQIAARLKELRKEKIALKKQLEKIGMSKEDIESAIKNSKKKGSDSGLSGSDFDFSDILSKRNKDKGKKKNWFDEFTDGVSNFLDKTTKTIDKFNKLKRSWNRLRGKRNKYY